MEHTWDKKTGLPPSSVLAGHEQGLAEPLPRLAVSYVGGLRRLEC